MTRKRPNAVVARKQKEQLLVTGGHAKWFIVEES